MLDASPAELITLQEGPFLTFLAREWPLDMVEHLALDPSQSYRAGDPHDDNTWY